jgi:hypothetical protein
MVNHHFHYFLHQKLPNWGPKKASNRSPDWPPLWPGTPGAVDCHIFRQGLAMVLHIPTNVQYVTYNNSQKGSKKASNEFFRIFHLWQLRNLFGLFGKAKHWLVDWDKIAGRCFSYFQCGPHPTIYFTTPSYSHDDHAGITLFLHRICEMFMIVLLSAFLRAILCTL